MSRSDDPANWVDENGHPVQGTQHRTQPAAPQGPEPGYDPNSLPGNQAPYSQSQVHDPYAQPVSQAYQGHQPDPNGYQTPQPQNYSQPVQPGAQHPQGQMPPGVDPYQQVQQPDGYPSQMGEIASQVHAGSTTQPAQSAHDPYQDAQAVNNQMRHEHSQPGHGSADPHSQYATPEAHQPQQPMTQPAHDLAQQAASELQSYYSQQHANPDVAAQQATGYDSSGQNPAHYNAAPPASDYDLGGLMASGTASPVQAEPNDHFHVSTDLSHEAARVDFGQQSHPEPSFGQTQHHDMGHIAEHFTHAATGAVGSMEPTLQSDAEFYANEYDNEEYEEIEEPRSRMGGIVKLATTLSLAIITGAGLAYGYKFFVSSGGGKNVPAIIRADIKPAKITPANPGGKKFAHTKKAIFDRVGGPPKSDPRISDESATSMPGISLSSGPSSPALARPSISSSGGATKVRTVSVRPDGSYAPSKPLRPSRPANIAKIRSQAETVEIPGITVGGAKPAAFVRPTVKKPSSAVKKTLNDELMRQISGAKPAAIKPAAKKPPVKIARATPKPDVRPAARVVGTSPNGYVSQISARKSRLDALSAFADLQQKYKTVLGSSLPDIQEANLGSKGVWYRLRIGPPGSKQAATDICTKLKSAGHKGCFVRAY